MEGPSAAVARARRTYALSVVSVVLSSVGAAAFWLYSLLMYANHGSPPSGLFVSGLVLAAPAFAIAGVLVGVVALNRRGPGRGRSITALWLGGVPLGFLLLVGLGRATPFGF